MSDIILDESGATLLDEVSETILAEGSTEAIGLPVIDHITDGRNRLLQQYRQSPRLIALQYALFSRQVQDLELAAHRLYGRLDIDRSQGLQLDHLGGIVGLKRSGWGDALYRILLKAKVGQNVSRGTLEDVISVWQILAQAGQVQVLETYPAQIDLYSDTPINSLIAGFIHALMQQVVAAGVRVDFLVIYSSTSAFGFDGEEVNVHGFGDLNDPGIGGELAYIQLSD